MLQMVPEHCLHVLLPSADVAVEEDAALVTPSLLNHQYSLAPMIL